MLALPSLSLLSLSEASMLTLPTELLTVLLSAGKLEPHGKLPGPFGLGESSIMLLILPLRSGIIMPLCAMTGDESGLLCSAMVEWWRFVLAREKSRPRE